MSIILISGANRGIGLGLAQTYLARDDTTVIGTARNPSEATELSSSPKGKNSRLFVLRYEAGSRTAAEELVAQILENKIDHVDILIANGGIGGYWSPALTSEADKLDQFFKINSLGNLLLFQALYPLLEKSQKPIFSFLSSSIASTENMEKVPFLGTAYGASKAWMDHVIKRIHIEQPNMISFAIHPGWVQTEMGNEAGASHGIGTATLTIEESVGSVVQQIDLATREKTSGKFLHYDGTFWPW